MTVMPSGLIVPSRQRVTVAQPAAGAEWAYTVPPGKYAKIISAFTTLTCSSTTGGRYPGLLLKDDAGITVSEIGAQYPSLSANYVTPISISAGIYLQSAGTTISSTGTSVAFSIFAVPLPAGYSWGSRTFGMKSNDRFSAVQLQVLLWDSEPYIEAFGPRWGMI